MSSPNQLDPASLLDAGAEKQQLIIDEILKRTWNSWTNAMKSENFQRAALDAIDAYIPVLERPPQTPEQRAQRYRERVERRM